MKKKILIINKAQFGYHTDSYKYCEYLRENFTITYLCFNNNLQKMTINNVKIIYVSSKGCFYIRAFRFFRTAYKVIKKNKYDLIFIVNFDFCFVLKYFDTQTKFILDIRTGSIKRKFTERKIQDLKIKINTIFFNNITIISKGLSKQLKLHNKKPHILGLGAESLTSRNKDYNELYLLYVGTFNNRNIVQTIEGFSKFYNNYKHKIKMSYTIIGFGRKHEEIKIRETINNEKINNIVNYIGHVPFDELDKYFDKSNIGISWIPITSYYQNQPSTKTFEYLLSGLVCIATKTKENKKIIIEENGILCKDKPDCFYSALKDIYNNRSHYNSLKIRNTGKKHMWKNIINDNLKEYLNSI